MSTDPKYPAPPATNNFIFSSCSQREVHVVCDIESFPISATPASQPACPLFGPSLRQQHRPVATGSRSLDRPTGLPIQLARCRDLYTCTEFRRRRRGRRTREQIPPGPTRTADSPPKPQLLPTVPGLESLFGYRPQP